MAPPNSRIVVETIERIPRQGSSIEKELADEALVDMRPHADGRGLIAEVQWGEQTPLRTLRLADSRSRRTGIPGRRLRGRPTTGF